MYSFMERYRIVSNTHKVLLLSAPPLIMLHLEPPKLDRVLAVVNAIWLSCAYTSILNIKFWQTYILALFASTK